MLTVLNFLANINNVTMRRLVYKPSALSNYLIRIQSEKWGWPRAKWVLNAAACAVRRPRQGSGPSHPLEFLDR